MRSLIYESLKSKNELIGFFIETDGSLPLKNGIRRKEESFILSFFITCKSTLPIELLPTPLDPYLILITLFNTN